ncbi:MAG: sugar phosphate isomerase/epimerase [Candidatus Omnitrophica bacterium]|nr:sugar phosphate isomerase/epimerase [Candidatus Omnitrophota bacterium]
MSLALSTSWNAFRAKSASDMLFEIQGLGFNEIELSFSLTAEMCAGVKKSIKASGLKVRSLHNYCPIPEGLTIEEALPDCFSMSSLDENERGSAVKHTLKTIETAADFQAQAVVLHCGRVEIADKTRDLIRLYEGGRNDFPEFKELRELIIRERKTSLGRHLDQTLKSLDTLNAAAKKRGVLLGVETRYYFREIPSLQEICLILKEFKGSQIGYWHDAGHAEVMERLGFYRHLEILELYKDSMLGIHLHDLTGCHDHKAPGQGDLDFTKIKPYLSRDCLKIMEAHHPAATEDIKNGKVLLERVFDGLI